MHRPWLRWWRVIALAGCWAMVAGCDSGGGGVGISVGLPASYGSMELGVSTSQWIGGPTW